MVAPTDILTESGRELTGVPLGDEQIGSPSLLLLHQDPVTL